MKTLIACVLATSVLAGPAFAALEKGAKAPTFKTQASQAGKPFSYDLAAALKKGPVVLYFYPAAFTPGCNIEAKTFADAMPDFEKAGATVIGVSHDTIDTLNKFSADTQYCSGKFPVASDADGKISVSYDAVMKFGVRQVSSRTSYVIDKNGQVVFALTDGRNAAEHPKATLAAVQALKAR